MIDDDIRVLRIALADGPTPGPLYIRTNRHPTTDCRPWGWLDTKPPGAGQGPIPGVQVTWERGSRSEANARYIAAASPDRVARLLDEVERLRKENHDLNWALGTDGYATLSDPEDQAASDAAHAAAFANLDRLKARKTRHETLLPDGRDALDEIERLREALTAANAQAERFEREWYLRGDEVERLREDAERYRWLRGDSCADHSVRWTQWEVRCWRAPIWSHDLRRTNLDEEIDAALCKENTDAR